MSLCFCLQQMFLPHARRGRSHFTTFLQDPTPSCASLYITAHEQYIGTTQTWTRTGPHATFQFPPSWNRGCVLSFLACAGSSCWQKHFLEAKAEKHFPDLTPILSKCHTVQWSGFHGFFMQALEISTTARLCTLVSLPTPDHLSPALSPPSTGSGYPVRNYV